MINENDPLGIADIDPLNLATPQEQQKTLGQFGKNQLESIVQLGTSMAGLTSGLTGLQTMRKYAGYVNPKNIGTNQPVINPEVKGVAQQDLINMGKGTIYPYRHPIESGYKDLLGTTAAWLPLLGGATKLGMEVPAMGSALKNTILSKFLPVAELTSEQKIASQLQSAGTKYSEMAKGLTSAISKTEDFINNNKNLIDKDLIKAAETDTVTIKGKLPEFYKTNSISYGKQLDNISNKLISEGREITKDEAQAVINKTYNEMKSANVDTSVLDNLIEKYKIREADEVDLPISFKEFNTDIRNTTSRISSSAKIGKWLEGDQIASNLHANYGELIAEKVPEFANLQKAYRPVIQLMNKSSQIFKPSKIYETTTGTRFLKKVASGEPLQSEKNILSGIQGGAEGFAKGIGNLSKESMRIGKQIEDLKNMKVDVERYGASEMNKIVGQRKNRITQLKNRQIEITKLVNKKKAMQSLRNTLIGTAFGSPLAAYLVKKTFFE